MTVTTPLNATVPSVLRILTPGPEHAAGLADLIRRSPPLDANSEYCYLLLCSHFRDTCAIAVDTDGKVVGGVTAYLPPDRADTLFVWQLVVAESTRGTGLAGRLLDAVLARPQTRAIRWLETTVNPSNRASARVFERLASQRGVAVARSTLFAASAFSGDHEDEVQLRLGPFSPPSFSPSAPTTEE